MQTPCLESTGAQSWHPSMLVDLRRLLPLRDEAPADPVDSRLRARLFGLVCRETYRCGVPTDSDRSRIQRFARLLELDADQAWREIRRVQRDLDASPRVRSAGVEPRALLRRACVMVGAQGRLDGRGRELLESFNRGLGLEPREIDRILARLDASPRQNPTVRAPSRGGPSGGSRTAIATALPGRDGSLLNSALAPGISAGCGFAVAGLLTGHPVALLSAAGTGLLLTLLAVLGRSA